MLLIGSDSGNRSTPAFFPRYRRGLSSRQANGSWRIKTTRDRPKPGTEFHIVGSRADRRRTRCCVLLINEPCYQPAAINTAYTPRLQCRDADRDGIGLLRPIA